MIDTIVNILKESKATAWQITDTITRGWEFYFIRHDLDQNRAKDIENIHLTVFCASDDGVFLGNASDEINPSDTPNEIRKKIDQLIVTAGFVKNKAYTLNAPTDNMMNTGKETDIAQVAEEFITTMRSIEETDTEDINSYEIFVNQIERRYINSSGIDITETYPKSMVEAVINARKDGHEIELYRMYDSGTCDRQGLTRDIANTLRYGKDRLLASSTPQLPKMAVVFSTADAANIYHYYIDRLNAALVYRQMSNWQLNTAVETDVHGDTVTLKTVKELPNSSVNFHYDREGAPIREVTLMEENVPLQYWGERMFASYLDLKNCFNISNVVVSGGKKTEAQLRTGKYLEIVEFSDFQVNPVTGNVFGEIRLGYLHDGEKVTVVSGGSVSGNMSDYIKELYISQETVQYDNIVVPAVTRIENMTITGAE